MAGLILIGAVVVAQAVHDSFQTARSPLITLDAPPPIDSEATASKKPRRLSLCRYQSAPDAVSPAQVSTITKRALKKLGVEWAQRGSELTWRIEEIERHFNRGYSVCYAGKVANLSKMKLALVEADHLRDRYNEAVAYLRALPEPLQSTSINPLNRHSKSVLPASSMPPTLVGLPVPLPKPPRSGDWATKFIDSLPAYHPRQSTTAIDEEGEASHSEEAGDDGLPGYETISRTTTRRTEPDYSILRSPMTMF